MTRERRQGPVYDDAMKVLADDDVAALLAVLGISDVGERLTIEVTQSAMRTDLLVAVGASRVAHVESISGRPADICPRMISYWNRIEGRAELLAELIRQRFGDDPRVDKIAGRLVDLPDRDGLARIAAAAGVDDLVDRARG